MNGNFLSDYIYIYFTFLVYECKYVEMSTTNCDIEKNIWKIFKSSVRCRLPLTLWHASHVCMLYMFLVNVWCALMDCNKIHEMLKHKILYTYHSKHIIAAHIQIYSSEYCAKSVLSAVAVVFYLSCQF